MKKYSLIILFFAIAINGFTQNKIITKYYDSTWQSVSKEKANFYTEFKLEDSFYRVTSYYYPSMKLYGKSTFADTLFKKGIGVKVTYYESGATLDSTLYINNGGIIENIYYENGKRKEKIIYDKNREYFDEWIYYENGKKWAHLYKNENNPRVVNEVFDSISGNLIPNYIYEQPAEFKGGAKGWSLYLMRNLNSDVTVRHRAPSGEYTVFVKFMIDEKGYVSKVEAENDPGYGTKEEAMRVIRNSPKWEPAIQLNKPVKIRHRQSITFRVQ